MGPTTIPARVAARVLSPDDTIEPTTEQVEAFKSAWHRADLDGRSGERVRDGLRAVLNMTDDEPTDLLAALEESLHEAKAHELFQQQHPGLTEAHELYAELFEDWREEARP